MNIRLAGIQSDSIVDGPGVRLTFYVQGCSHRCYGCHNPETHDPAGGRVAAISQLTDLIDASRGIDGVTISGGEPFEQAEAAAVLASEIIKRKLNLVLYSGYTFEELKENSSTNQDIFNLLAAGLILVDGPFILAEQDFSLPYRGSRNQRLIDLPRSLAAGRALDWSGSWGRIEALYERPSLRQRSDLF